MWHWIYNEWLKPPGLLSQLVQISLLKFQNVGRILFNIMTVPCHLCVSGQAPLGGQTLFIVALKLDQNHLNVLVYSTCKILILNPSLNTTSPWGSMVVAATVHAEGMQFQKWWNKASQKSSEDWWRGKCVIRTVLLTWKTQCSGRFWKETPRTNVGFPMSKGKLMFSFYHLVGRGFYSVLTQGGAIQMHASF